MQEQLSTDEINLDNDSSNYSRLVKYSKKYVFNLMYPIIGSESFSNTFRFILFFINYWKNSLISDVFLKIFSITTIVYYINQTSFQVYMIFFYIVVAIMVLLIFNMFIINFSTNSKNLRDSKKSSKTVEKGTFPISILKLFCEIYLQLLFLPFIEILLNIFYCVKNNQSVLVHQAFSEVQCYKGVYIVHTIVAIVTLIVLIAFGVVISLLFFDCRFKTDSTMAKNHGRNDLNFTFFKLILSVFFNIFSSTSFSSVLIFLYTLGSIILFTNVNKTIVYQNFWVHKLAVMQQSLAVWTSMILIFALVTSSLLFNAVIYIWIIGLFLVIFVVGYRKEYRIDLLIMNSMKVENTNIFMLHMDYLIKFMKYYHISDNVAMLFDGFIEYHKTICNIDECPSKKKFAKTKKYAKIFTEEEETEEIIQLVHLIDTFYVNALQKFPNNTEIRIHHGLFLLDKFKQKQQALQEFMIAELEQPPFDEQFIIFRLKKIIELEIVNDMHDNNKKDSINEISFQNHIYNCKIGIEKSVYMHLDFWSQLSEDIPDLVRLYDIGYKINFLNDKIDEHWNFLMSMNIEMQIMLRYYAKYLLNILNDRSGCDRLMEKVRKNNNNKFTQFTSTHLNDFTTDSTPTVFISGEEENMGFITNLNLAAASIFGFTKNELLNRKVNLIMPQMYSKFHDKFIEHYILTLETFMINREKLVPGRNKNNYIVPVYLSIKHVNSVTNGIQFSGSFRVEKTFKNYAYLLTDKDGIIEIISSSCINILGLTQKKLTKKQNKIVDIIPEFLNNIGEFLDNKNGSITKVKTLHDKTDTLMYANALGVTFRNNALQGYFVRLEPCQNSDKTVDINSISRNLKKTHQNMQNRKYFTMKYEINSKVYLGEIKEGVISTTTNGVMNISNVENDVLANSCFVDPNNSYYENGDTSLVSKSANRSYFAPNSLRVEMKANAAESRLLKKIEEMNQKTQDNDNRATSEKIDYAYGIKTMRLFKDRLMYEEEIKKEEDSEDDDEEKKSKEEALKRDKEMEEENEFQQADSKNIFKNRMIFMKYMKETKFLENKYLKRLKMMAIMIIICFVVLSFSNYFLNANILSTINTSYVLSQNANKRVSLTQGLLFNVLELTLLNLNVIKQAHNTTEKVAYYNTLKSKINELLLKLEVVQKNLQINSFGLSEKNNDLFSKDSIPLTYLQDGEKKVLSFDINEATQQMISKSFEMQNSFLSNFTFDNPSVFFLQYNNMNSYLLAVRSAANLYITELDARSIENKKYLIIPIYSYVVKVSNCILIVLRLRKI